MPDSSGQVRGRADSTLQELLQLQSKAKSGRSRFEPTWYVNLAYYAGNQWVFWNRGRLDQPALEPWRVTFTDNRIIGIVRTEIAKMTKQRPAFVVTPTRGDDDAVANAEMAERVLDYLWNSLDLQRKQRTALMWARVCGAGFWKTYWDSTAGPRTEVILGADGQPLTDQTGQVMTTDKFGQVAPADLDAQLQQMGMRRKSLAMGEVCVEVRSPWELAPDPLAGDEGLHAAEWVIETTVKSKDSLITRYGDRAQSLKEDAQASVGIAEQRMSSGLNPSSSSEYRGVTVNEYWAKPSSTFPRGRRVVWANEEILVEEDNPYECLPYTMFSGIPVPGRFWPTSIVEQLRSPQAEFNKTRSQIRENAARIGNPSLLIPRSSNVQIQGPPGEQIVYDDMVSAAGPSYLQPPEMPVYVREEGPQIEGSMQEISGQHEITKGQVPPGVTAAAAINMLMEADDTRLGPDIYDMERSLADAGKLLLGHVSRYYTDQRTLRILGDEGDWDIFEFRNDMIEKEPDVQVQAGSSMPRMKSAKQAAMADFLRLVFQAGTPPSKRDLARYLKNLDVGGFEALIEDTNRDEQQVAREHRVMAQGQPLPINSYDDDDAHVAGHMDYMKGARYQRMIAQDGRLAQLFEMHLAAHQQRQQQAQQAQAQQQKDIESAAQQVQAQAQLEVKQIEGQQDVQQLQIEGQQDMALEQLKQAGNLAQERLRARTAREQAMRKASTNGNA